MQKAPVLTEAKRAVALLQPAVAGTGFEPMSSAYETDELTVFSNPL